MHRRGLSFAFVSILVLLAGCAGLHRLETSGDANRHMRAALKMENDRQIPEAVREYAYVAREYPDSRFYKTAVFKAALLSGHPENRQADLSESLYWFQQYQELGLSETERQGVEFIITLMKQKREYQDDSAKVRTEFQKLKAAVTQHDLEAAAQGKQIQDKNEEIHQLELKITHFEEQIKAQNGRIAQLQAEISKSQEALQQLKNVDLQIHRSRTKETK